MIEQPRTGVVRIDCSGCGKAELLELFARELHAPDWFGHNLDALYDLLTERDAALRVELLHWDQAALTHTERAGFEEVFVDARHELGEDRLGFWFISRIV